jgi:hypothetical protein
VSDPYIDLKSYIEYVVQNEQACSSKAYLILSKIARIRTKEYHNSACGYIITPIADNTQTTIQTHYIYTMVSLFASSSTSVAAGPAGLAGEVGVVGEVGSDSS